MNYISACRGLLVTILLSIPGYQYAVSPIPQAKTEKESVKYKLAAASLYSALYLGIPHAKIFKQLATASDNARSTFLESLSKNVQVSEFKKTVAAHTTHYAPEIGGLVLQAGAKETLKYVLAYAAAANHKESVTIGNTKIDVSNIIDPAVEIAFGVGNYCKEINNKTKREFNKREAAASAVKTAGREVAAHTLVWAGNKTGVLPTIEKQLPAFAKSEIAKITYMQTLRTVLDVLIEKYA